MTDPTHLLQPLPFNKHRRLERHNIADVLVVAGWLSTALARLGRYGGDPATVLQLERWRDIDGRDLSALADRLSNDALVRAEIEIEREDEGAEQCARDAAADFRIDQRKEEMAL